MREHYESRPAVTKRHPFVPSEYNKYVCVDTVNFIRKQSAIYDNECAELNHETKPILYIWFNPFQSWEKHAFDKDALPAQNLVSMIRITFNNELPFSRSPHAHTRIAKTYPA